MAQTGERYTSPYMYPPAFPPMSANLASLFGAAEQAWKNGEMESSIAAYDRALEVARRAGDSSLEAQILLGKGYAILHPPNTASDDFDPTLETLGRDCVQQSYDMAMAAGRPQAAAFAKQILDAVGAPLTLGEAAGDSSGTGTGKCCSSGWTPQLDAALVKLVADHGDGEWDEKAQLLPGDFTGSDVQRRWLKLRPRVKESMTLAPDAVRDCGHSCGDCPTRDTCHLHEAQDIEELCADSASCTRHGVDEEKVTRWVRV